MSNFVTDLLLHIGEDPQREGLRETPRRVAEAWTEWTRGYHEDPAKILKVFEDGAEGCDQMIVLDSIPVQSHCEHHLAPFVGTATIGYVPDGKIVGLSKFGRLVNCFSKRLQVQERITNQIADAINDVLKPKGVGVVIRAEHFCMATRGVHMPGVFTTTSALRGIMLEPGARDEFLAFARNNKKG